MHVLQTTVQHPSDPSIRTTWLPSLPPGLLPALGINLDPSYVLSLCVHVHRILSILHPLPIKKAIHSSKLRMSALQFSSVTQSCLTLCSPMDCSTPGLPVHHQLPEPTQTHVHSVSDAIQPSHSRSSPFPPVFDFSQHQGLFQWTGSSHQVAKVLEFQLKHQSFQWIFRTDFLYGGLLDLLAVQGTLKSLLQHNTSKTSILQCSAFFIFQLSHPYVTTGKTIALTRQAFVGKVMSLLLNMLSSLVITFLLGKKTVKNPDSVLKSRDITLLTKVLLVEAMVFPVVMYGCESWTIKKAEHWRIDVFEVLCWRRLLRVPWTARRSNSPP